MQYSNKYRIFSGFTLIESMLGILVIGLVSGSIMLGITTVEKKLFNIRLKEQAFEVLDVSVRKDKSGHHAGDGTLFINSFREYPEQDWGKE